MANWNGITREINMIIEKMRSEARLNSSMESRQNIHVLFQTPLRLSSLDFEKDKSNGVYSVKMTSEDWNDIMSMDMSGGVLTIKVYEDTRIISNRREARRESKRIANDLVTFVLRFRSVFVEHFLISMDFPDYEVRSYGRIKCGMMYARVDRIGKWLNRVDARYVYFDDEACVIDDRYSMEMVMKCNRVDMEVKNGITNELLMSFEGSCLELGPSQVTASGINRFMKRMFRRRFTKQFTEEGKEEEVDYSFAVEDRQVMDILEGMKCRNIEVDGEEGCIPQIAPHWTITKSRDSRRISFKLDNEETHW